MATTPRRTRRYERALAGDIPADELPTSERAQLVAELHILGWTDADTAAHTRMTTYTTARIRARLGLRAHHARKVPTE